MKTFRVYKTTTIIEYQWVEAEDWETAEDLALDRKNFEEWEQCDYRESVEAVEEDE